MLEKRQESLPQRNTALQLPTEESISLKLNSPDLGNASGTQPHSGASVTAKSWGHKISDNSLDVSIDEVDAAIAAGVKDGEDVGVWGVIHHDVGVLAQRHTADQDGQVAWWVAGSLSRL